MDGLMKTCCKLEISNDILEINQSMKDKLEKSCLMAKKWLPPIENSDKLTIMNILTGTDISFGTPLLRKYLELLKPYTEVLGLSGEHNRPREADCVASGIVFFYGCLVYIMHFPGWGKHIEDIFLYDMLYILVDHYIDDIRIDPTQKQQAINQMKILINEPGLHETMELIDPVLKVIAMTYQRLLERCPNVKESIIKLFSAEIEGLSIQKNNESTREKYYDIALRKGGYTMEVLQYIVGDDDKTISEASYHIGTIMQLVDDSADVISDKTNGIHTIATHDLENKGNIDELWMDIIERINKIDDRFTIFIILYTVFAIYLPDRIKEAYTDELRNKTNPLNMFDYNYGCDGSSMLVNTIMDELSSIDALYELKKCKEKEKEI